MSTIYPDIMSERRYLNTPASMCVMGNSVDDDIVPFLKQLNGYPWLVTTSCCSGHDQREPWPYVGIAIKSDSMRKLVNLLIRIDECLKTEHEGYLDCELTFQQDCAVSCYFKDYPDWLMFNLRIQTAAEDYSLKFWEALAQGAKVKRNG